MRPVVNSVEMVQVPSCAAAQSVTQRVTARPPAAPGDAPGRAGGRLRDLDAPTATNREGGLEFGDGSRGR